MQSIEPTFAIIVVIDLANSTRFIEKVGDRRAAEVFQLYDRIFRGLLIKYSGIEIDKTDGALLLFESIKEAVLYSLEYHKLVEKHLNLQSRVGIHAGIVMMHSNSEIWVARGAKPIEVEGVHKSICARVCSLADPGQILLTQRAAQVTMSHASAIGGILIANMGKYILKGVKNPMPIYGVALKNQKDRLRLPSPKEKVKRHSKPPISTKEKWRRRFWRYLVPYILLHTVRAYLILACIWEFPSGWIHYSFDIVDSIIQGIHSIFTPDLWIEIWDSISKWIFKLKKLI